MNKLSVEDAAYLSGLFEWATFHMNKSAVENDRGYKIELSCHLRDKANHASTLSKLLGVEVTQFLKKESGPFKLIHCQTQHSTMIKTSKRNYIQLRPTIMRHLLPYLSFRNPKQEKTRVLMLKILELTTERVHTWGSKDPQKIARMPEIDKEIEEIIEAHRKRYD